ncbi:MAG: HNH endonuclease [Smithella sp.]|jgi:hypothetical protein
MNTKKYQCHYCGKDVIRRSAPSIKTKLHFCNNSCKSEYQKTLKPVSREWLYDHYVIKGMNTTEIGHIVNRDPKGVWNWLKDFGIPTRPRGGFTSPGCFQKGQENPFKGRKHSQGTKDKIRAARLKDGRIPSMKDGVHWMKHEDYKVENHPSWRGGVSPERQIVYSSTEWSDAVKEVWKRDNAICQRCGKHHNKKGIRGTFHIHHIVSFEVKELRIDPSNLILLCKNCHRWVHGKNNINKEFIKGV